MASRSITRRQFVEGTTAAAGLAAVWRRAEPKPIKKPATRPNPEKPAMKIGFHTDAFNSAYFSFEKCLEWAQRNGVHYIECGLIDGVSWVHGLGY